MCFTMALCPFLPVFARAPHNFTKKEKKSNFDIFESALYMEPGSMNLGLHWFYFLQFLDTTFGSNFWKFRGKNLTWFIQALAATASFFDVKQVFNSLVQIENKNKMLLFFPDGKKKTWQTTSGYWLISHSLIILILRGTALKPKLSMLCKLSKLPTL